MSDLRGASVGALAILFVYSSGFTSSHIHLLLRGTIGEQQKTAIELRASIAKLLSSTLRVHTMFFLFQDIPYSKQLSLIIAFLTYASS